MDDPTTVYLLRHATSQPDPSIPEADWPLSAEGRRQAIEWVPRLKELGIQAICSSPFVRAVETVRPFALQADLEIEMRPDLRERILVSGIVPHYLELVEASFRDPEFAPPGGESARACQTRIRQALDDLALNHCGQVVLACSHGNAIAFYLRSLDERFDFERWRCMPNPALYRVDYSDGQPEWDEAFACR